RYSVCQVRSGMRISQRLLLVLAACDGSGGAPSRVNAPDTGDTGGTEDSEVDSGVDTVLDTGDTDVEPGIDPLPDGVCSEGTHYELSLTPERWDLPTNVAYQQESFDSEGVGPRC